MAPGMEGNGMGVKVDRPVAGYAQVRVGGRQVGAIEWVVDHWQYVLRGRVVGAHPTFRDAYRHVIADFEVLDEGTGA